jgi:hypothetical protein
MGAIMRAHGLKKVKLVAVCDSVERVVRGLR